MEKSQIQFEIEKLNLIVEGVIRSVDIDCKIKELKCENNHADMTLKDGRHFKVVYTQDMAVVIEQLLK
jgi:hypothetical protein